MTQDEMQAAVDKLAAMMGEKGLRIPSATVNINANAAGNVLLQWAKGNDSWASEYKAFTDGNLSDQIAAATAWIAAQPTPEERKLREFQTALGRVIDLGRENGIDVAFVNPLAELAKSLAENAITDQREVAA